MNTNKPDLEKIEKRLWQFVLLAIVVILFLTLTLLLFQLVNMLEQPELTRLVGNLGRYSIFLAVLILLFCAYMIVYQRRLLALSRELYKEKESAHKLSRDVQILRSLFNVSAKINSQKQLKEILNTIATEMLRCFDADHSSIMLIDTQLNMLKTMVSVGKGAEHAEDALLPIGQNIAGRVVKIGKPIMLHGKVNPAEFPGTVSKERNISSALCVPLKMGPKCIGVLNLNLLDRERKFSKTDLKLIAVFANNAAVAIYNSMLSKDRQQRIQMQALFEQMHSPQVVRELVKKVNAQDRPHKFRKKMELTVLFADIQGFSDMMNAVRLEDVMDFLDEFYSAMTKAVLMNQGNIDKFIGDEVMAFFGAPEPLENSGENCLKAAREMITAFESLREIFAGTSPHFKKLGIGIGLNTGKTFVGNVGSASHYDYTVIGKAVNLARRLCSNADSGQILASETTVNKIYGMNSSPLVENIVFKGMLDPVNVYRMG